MFYFVSQDWGNTTENNSIGVSTREQIHPTTEVFRTIFSIRVYATDVLDRVMGNNAAGFCRSNCQPYASMSPWVRGSSGAD